MSSESGAGSPPVKPGEMRLEVVVAPGSADYGSFVAFSDPDGNGWLLQEIKTRLPGR